MRSTPPGAKCNEGSVAPSRNFITTKRRIHKFLNYFLMNFSFTARFLSYLNSANHADHFEVDLALQFVTNLTVRSRSILLQ